MEIKTARDFFEGGLGWGKRENSSFFFSHSNSLSRANEASALSNCRKKNFCGQAMFNHSYLQSIFEKEVSKIAMVMSVKTNGIPNPPKPTAPSHHPPSFRLPKYIVAHNHGSITLSSK